MGSHMGSSGAAAVGGERLRPCDGGEDGCVIATLIGTTQDSNVAVYVGPGMIDFSLLAGFMTEANMTEAQHDLPAHRWEAQARRVRDTGSQGNRVVTIPLDFVVCGEHEDQDRATDNQLQSQVLMVNEVFGGKATCPPFSQVNYTPPQVDTGFNFPMREIHRLSHKKCWGRCDRLQEVLLR